MITAFMACITLFWTALWVIACAWLAKRWTGRRDVLVMLLTPVIMTSTALFFAWASVVVLNFIE